MGLQHTYVHTLVVPNSPSFVIVKVDIPFSVGLREEGMGQDAPRPVKRQVVPMPVPGERGGGENTEALEAADNGNVLPERSQAMGFTWRSRS